MVRWNVLLRPLAWLYAGVMALRNAAFRCGLLPSHRFPLPVIAVGNLAVGGTGKTPHAEYLLRLLAPRCATAFLSRGYGRRSHGYVAARPGVTAADVGDEPLQVWRKFPDVAVAVCASRCDGIRHLLESAAPPDVIVLDDAFQHRYVRAGLYILLTDRARLYVDDHVLPEGRLRESRAGACRADVIIVTKCPADLSAAACADIRRRLHPGPGQDVFFSTFSYGRPYGLFTDEAPSWAGRDVLLLTGIARPESLRRHVGADAACVHPLSFPDHHTYTAADARRIGAALAALPAGSVVVTTEKDAARLAAVADALSPAVRSALIVQPVEVRFLHGEEEAFNTIIHEYVATHQRNG